VARPRADWKPLYEAKRSIAATYARALVRVRQQIGLLYQYFSDSTGKIDYAALYASDRGRAIVADLKKWTAELRLRTPEEIRKALDDAYINSLNRTLDDVRRFGVDLTKAQREQAAAYRTAGIEYPPKSPPLSSIFARNQALSAQRLNQALSVFTWAGGTEAEAVAAFKSFLQNEAGRMFRVLDTEGNRTINAARAQVFDFSLEVEAGEGLEKYWSTTIDNETRHTHLELNNEPADEEGEWHIGELSASMPGGWGDPAEDCNCRCEIGIRRKIA
jgi:hypothetical protein